MGNQYIVKWGNILQDNYNYGATISFDKKGSVSYASPLMPPSLCIKNWYSQRPFHISRNTPYLPILSPGKTYKLTVRAEFDQENAIQLKLLFYDRYQELIDEQYCVTLSEYFTFPQEAVHYEIQLINKHHKWLVFHQLEITEQAIEELYEHPQILKHGIRYYPIKLDASSQEQATIKLVFLHQKMQVQHLRFTSKTNYLYCLLDSQSYDLIAIMVEIYGILLKQNLRTVEVEFAKETNYYRLPSEIQQIPNVLNHLLNTKNEVKSNDKSNWYEEITVQTNELHLAIQVLTVFLNQKDQ